MHFSNIENSLRPQKDKLGCNISRQPLSKLVHIFGAKKIILVRNQVKKRGFF
jgi:hypothetical protein